MKRLYLALVVLALGAVALAGTASASRADPLDDSADDQLIGNLWTFSGTKTFSCGAGQFTLAYRSYRIGDAASSLGTWEISGGTGIYAGMKGIDVVQGRYTYDGGGQKTGIVDSYAGLVLLSP